MPSGLDVAGDAIMWSDAGRVAQPDPRERQVAQLLPIIADLEAFAKRELGASAAVESCSEEDALVLVVIHDTAGIEVERLAAVAKLITDWFVEVLPEELWGRVFVDFRAR